MNIINIPKEIKIELIEREIVSKKNWALQVSIDGGYNWVVCSWPNKPKDLIVNNMKDVVIGSMEVYHRQLKIPSFNLKKIEN